MHVTHRALGIHLDIQHPLGDNSTLACTGLAGILNGVFQVEQDSRLGAESRSSTNTVPRFNRSRLRSRVRSMTASSSG